MELENIGESGRRRSVTGEIFYEDEGMVPNDHDLAHRQRDDELELQWAAIERLPTFQRIRTSLFDKDKDVSNDEGCNNRRMVDVRKLGNVERRLFIENLIKKVEEDNHRLLQNLKERIDRIVVFDIALGSEELRGTANEGLDTRTVVGLRVELDLPTIEVRYKNLCVEAFQELAEGKPLPTLWNTVKSMLLGFIINSGKKRTGNKVKILRDVSGILKPSRLTLLLGPPGCGKTTFLQALAGTPEESLKVTGDISYNGYKLNEFVPQKTSAYISQYDQHITEMTVRETLDFSARCQGVGGREDMMREISKKEKQAGITPDPDIDVYMKAISAKGLKRSLQTDYILKILGLDICADTIVGDAMTRGVSGGQKKRVTTGEMMVGPARALFMDEISTGLDSSTTFQIVKCLQQLAHITNSTILVSLLQPAPETFELFDDVILMAEGQIVYHGPRDSILEFFEHCGFRCPQRKGISDFLQEVVSKKDQAQYWYDKERPYSFVSIDYLAKEFRERPIWVDLDKELSRPLDKSEDEKNAFSFDQYSLTKWELFKACLAREWLLMKRNSFVHAFKTAQLVFVAVVSMTVFIRTRMKVDAAHATLYLSSLFYALIRLMVNGIQELGMTVSRLQVFYKHRDFYFYPAWAYTIPAAVLKIPFSMLDAFLWTALTYYVIGYSPEPQRFFGQFLLLFLVHQVAISQFRLIASMVRNPSIASTVSLFFLLVIFLFGGFVIPKPSLPDWLAWSFWISPLSYAEIGASLNEFLAPRWQKISPSNVTLGHQVLQKRGLDYSSYYYWISVLALVGYWLVYNIGFSLALTFSKTPQKSQTVIACKRRSHQSTEKDGSSMAVRKQGSRKVVAETTGMVLPFEPTTLTFENLHYYVDTPQKLRERGFTEKRLQLLQNITGTFRPGVLTALMGISGAGKTTLMDVLSGRKTGGVIEGEIKVGGYPKVQATYARISGYCEQTDIHSPQLTIEESVLYSAWLRLPSEVEKHTRVEFVNEVLEKIELDNIKDAIVGIPGMGGISTEQRKRLTIAVELVSNPSIIFLDEPTSGLDARAAAIVMRVVKNIVHTGRTIVCTIHQPSIDIFEAFDELVLLKRGGQMIYAGELGEHSSKLINYFESIPGVPKIKENYNPSTWMLEITTSSMEAELGIDYNTIYKESPLFRINDQLVRQYSSPSGDSKELYFPSKFPQSRWEQFKACLWKQHLTYWRSPKYNLVRMAFICVSSLVFGALLWQKGQNIKSEQDFLNILGAMFIFLQFTGVSNASAVMPFIATERIVIYREMFAGMYSSWAYTLAQVTIEVPYVFLQAVLFVVITYPAVGFYWSIYKVFWYFYTSFCTMLYFNYFGMMIVSLTPSYQVATVCASLCYTMFNLFAGYLIPGPHIPGWWVWCYWICPTAWSLKGLLTSQYGDINDPVTVYGESTTIKGFLGSTYSYDYDQLGIVAVVLLAFPLIFASVFAYAIAKLNFQKR